MGDSCKGHRVVLRDCARTVCCSGTTEPGGKDLRTLWKSGVTGTNPGEVEVLASRLLFGRRTVSQGIAGPNDERMGQRYYGGAERQEQPRHGLKEFKRILAEE